MTRVCFQPFILEEHEVGKQECVTAWAHTPTGEPVCVRIFGVGTAVRVKMHKSVDWSYTNRNQFAHHFDWMRDKAPIKVEFDNMWPLYGYQEETDLVATFYFRHSDHLRFFGNLLTKGVLLKEVRNERLFMDAFEWDVPMWLQMLQRHKFAYTDWLQYTIPDVPHRGVPDVTRDPHSKLRHDYSVHISELSLVPREETDTYRLSIKRLCFDMEVYGKGFPERMRETDAPYITTIRVSNCDGSYLRRYTLTALPHYTEGVKVAGLDEDVELLHCGTPQQMMRVFAEIINREDPSIIAGHNMCQFDIPYCYATMTNHFLKFPDISRLATPVDQHRGRDFVSKALGHAKFFQAEGRICLDTRMGAITSFSDKNERFGLKVLCQEYLEDTRGHQKLEMTPQQMRVAYEAVLNAMGPNEIRAARALMDEVIVYGMVDADLVDRLLGKWNTINAIMSLSHFSGVHPEDIQSGHQRVLWDHIYYIEGARDGYYGAEVEFHKDTKMSDQLTGGTVIDIGHGAASARHTKLIHAATHERLSDDVLDHTLFDQRPPGKYILSNLDFKSLYPSQIIAHNLCITTHNRGPPGAQGPEVEVCEYTDLANEVEEYDEEMASASAPNSSLHKYFPATMRIKRQRTVERERVWRREFVTKKRRLGILPRILDTLWAKRQGIKKIQKGQGKQLQEWKEQGITHPDAPEVQFQFNKNEADQQNIKLIMNSSYGYMAKKNKKVSLDGVKKKWHAFRRVSKGDQGIAQVIPGLGRADLLRAYTAVVKEKYSVVYADTDSLMVETTIQEVADGDAHALATSMNKNFPAPVELEYEESFVMLITASKMYARIPLEGGKGLAVASDIDVGKYKVKGMMTKRGDSTRFIGTMFDKIAKTILLYDGKQAFLRVMHTLTSGMDDIANGRVRPDELAVSKRYNASSSSGALFDMTERLKAGGRKLYHGDDLRYVVVRSDHPQVSQRMRLLDELQPSDVLDAEYYLGACSRIDDLLLAVFRDCFDAYKWHYLSKHGPCVSVASAFPLHTWSDIMGELRSFVEVGWRKKHEAHKAATKLATHQRTVRERMRLRYQRLRLEQPDLPITDEERTADAADEAERLEHLARDAARLERSRARAAGERIPDSDSEGGVLSDADDYLLGDADLPTPHEKKEKKRQANDADAAAPAAKRQSL